MLSLDSGDKIRGDASTAAVVDYTIHGLDANAIKQLADGQLANTIGDLFTADSADVVTTIILVNTHSSAITCNLYLTPSGGTARRLIAKDTSLGIGSSLHFDGAKVSVLDSSGQILSTWAVDDTPVNGETAQPISSNWAYDHANAADPHTGYVLESLLDAKGDGIFASADNAPAKVTVGANDTVLTAASGETAGVKWAAAATGVTLALKTGDQIVNNSDTLVNVTDLAIAIAANEIWIIEAIIYGQFGSTPDVDFTFTVPTAATGVWWKDRHIADISGTSPIAEVAFATENTCPGANSNAIYMLWAWVVNSSNAGNVQLQFAQNTPTVYDSTMRQNSLLRGTKIG